MDFGDSDASEVRFTAYVEALAEVIGHADRAGRCVIIAWAAAAGRAQERRADGGGNGAGPVCGEAPVVVAFRRQGAVVGRAGAHQGARAGPAGDRRQGPIEAWIIDDTGFPKKGRHSVGVARQYCGQLGKQDNCQVAVACRWPTAGEPAGGLAAVSAAGVDGRSERRAAAGIPETVGFLTKPEIALEQIRRPARPVCRAGLC